MFEYSFSKDPLILGDWSDTYGQSYWAEVNEDLKPVKFNLTERGVQLHAGDKITCEVSENKRSLKGVDYLQLKKVKVGSKEIPKIPQQPIGGHDIILDMLIDINHKLDRLLNDEPPAPDPNEPLPDAPDDFIL